MNTIDYISISQFLGTAFPSEIKTIDLYNSQYLVENPKKEHPANYPAVYIEFLPTSWEIMTRGFKEGTSQVRFHIVLSTMQDTANIHLKSNTIQARVLAHYNLANQISSKLEGFKPWSALTALSKTEEQNDTNHDQVVAETFTFTYTRLDTDNADIQDQINKVIEGFLVTGDLIPLQSVLN